MHSAQEERFEVLRGTVKFKLVSKTVIAEAGDVVTVPAGVAHKFENDGDETAHVRVRVAPALVMERLFETAVALAQEGRTTSKGLPKPLDLALFVGEFAAEVQGAFPPVWVQRGHGRRYAPARPARPAYAA